MKTHVFKNFDLSEKPEVKVGISGLHRDFQTMIKFNDDDLKKLIIDFIEYDIDRKKPKEELKTQVKKKLSINDEEFDRLLGIIEFFYDNFLPNSKHEDDSAEDLVEDMKNLGILEKDFQRVILILQFIKENVKKRVIPIFHQRRIAKKARKTLNILRTSVGFDAIFEDEAKYGEEKNDYSPSCLGFAPMINLELKLNGRENETINFTCDDTDIEMIITTLKNSLIELKNAKKFANLDNYENKIR